MIHWIVYSTLATGVLYGLYCLLFRRDGWLQVSRWYLIVALAFSLAYPLLRLPLANMPALELTEWAGIEAVEVYAENMPWADTMQATGTQKGNGIRVLGIGYLAGLSVSLVVLLAQLATQAVRFQRHTKKRSDNGLSLLDDETPPCSFFDHIIVGVSGMSNEELRCVLTHEGEHVRRRHSIDVLVMRLLCCCAWFNPFAWLLLRELKAVHEYQADAAACAANGNRDYLCLLFRQATGIGYGHITNNFQSINLKKRIEMMKRKKSRYGAWKLMAALPVAALLMMAGSTAAHATSAGNGAEQALLSENNSGTNSRLHPNGSENPYKSPTNEAPEFIGGTDSLYHFLAQNIHYPEQAKLEKIEGRVVVQFVVEADGRITEAEVLRGIGGGCDEEALRVIAAMPKWKPGTENGKPVRSQYVIPVVFRLGQ